MKREAVKNGRGIVDEFGAGIADEESEAAGEALFDFRVEAIVVGIADVVAEEGDVVKFGERLQQLRIREWSDRPIEEDEGIWPKNGFGTVGEQSDACSELVGVS